MGTLARVTEKGVDSVLGWTEVQASQTFELLEELRPLKQGWERVRGLTFLKFLIVIRMQTKNARPVRQERRLDGEGDTERGEGARAYSVDTPNHNSNHKPFPS